MPERDPSIYQRVVQKLGQKFYSDLQISNENLDTLANQVGHFSSFFNHQIRLRVSNYNAHTLRTDTLFSALVNRYQLDRPSIAKEDVARPGLQGSPDAYGKIRGRSANASELISAIFGTSQDVSINSLQNPENIAEVILDLALAEIHKPDNIQAFFHLRESAK